MGPTWGLSAPDGPHVGPMNFALWVTSQKLLLHFAALFMDDPLALEPHDHAAQGLRHAIAINFK